MGEITQEDYYRGIEQRERLVCTFILVGSFLVSTNEKLSSIFSGFLIMILIYHISLTRSKTQFFRFSYIFISATNIAAFFTSALCALLLNTYFLSSINGPLWIICDSYVVCTLMFVIIWYTLSVSRNTHNTNLS